VTYAARYAPFGSLLWQQGTAPGPWGFAGETQDPTGLLYLRARWYDPALGRFLTRDPFPGLATLPTTQHPYTYALNNPVLYVDPTGEFLFLPLLAVAAAGGLLGGLGYYGIQAYMQADPCTGMQWDWGEALFWGGVGTVMGADIGVGIYGGWWAWTTLGPTITTGISAWPASWYGRQIIHGIEYTVHALEHMMPVGFGGRGVPPSAVENAIRFGTTFPGKEPGTVVHVYENLMVVTDVLGKTVITVIKTGH